MLVAESSAVEYGGCLFDLGHVQTNTDDTLENRDSSRSDLIPFRLVILLYEIFPIQSLLNPILVDQSDLTLFMLNQEYENVSFVVVSIEITLIHIVHVHIQRTTLSELDVIIVIKITRMTTDIFGNDEWIMAETGELPVVTHSSSP